MLSRVAHSLYWMSRYIERAENITRLLEVNLQLLLDFQDVEDDGALKDHWGSIIASSGNEELFEEHYDTADSYSVTFTKPGVYSYFCSLHPKMVGKVVVK